MKNKYGLFFGSSEKPMQTFEGDMMCQNAEYVYIHRRINGTRTEQVAAIKLGDGQCVKLIGDDSQTTSPRSMTHPTAQPHTGVWS
ncbi:MAG: hypothetical protein WA800_04310 [Terriglobales bacterium]